jgi:hypothetical protein
MLTGSCLCGDVSFTVETAAITVSGCNCGQCRKSSGNYGASAEFAADGVIFGADATLHWYRSSPIARRGFCGRCGSRLFWQEDGNPHLWIALGALDPPTGLRIERHIFVADKPDWYKIDDGRPQHPGYEDGHTSNKDSA